MDKELAQLHDLARTMLLEIQAKYEAGIIPPGFGRSDKKRLDKAISNLDFNPEAYGNIMEDVMTGQRGPKELMKRIRNVENNVMKAFELLNEDTIHHLVQQRTGGDFSKQVSGDVVRGAIKRLEDRFGLKFSQATGPGGVVRGDTALSNFAHKADLTQKGAELASGIGKNPDPSTTAHRFGTRGYSTTLTPQETRDEQALFDALEARIAPQLEDVQVGIATDQPRVQAIRAADPRLAKAYMPTNTAEEVAAMQPIARALSEDVKIQSYRQLLNFGNGKATLNRAALTGLAAAGVAAFGPLGTAASAAELAGRSQVAQQTGDFADEAQAALSGVSLAGDVASYFPPAAPIGEAVSTTADVVNIATDLYREDPERAKQFIKQQVTKAIPKPPVVQQVQQVQRAAQAVQRGGKLKFGLGKVQFTLPEFGLSELMGLN